MRRLAVLLLLAASPAQAAPADAVMAADRAFSALSMEKGTAYAFWFYSARTGRFYAAGGGGPRTGKSTAAPKTDPTASTKLSWEPTAGGVAGDGTQGWTDGVWKRVGPDGVRTGHYLTVWIKEDGSWKVQADMGTADPGPKASP
ncbi:MAG TPA: hypothetical protein VLL04_11515 [Rhizomicrobium sp.]|nr:hypothetical protein [Rhizomicrobium sp.]